MQAVQIARPPQNEKEVRSFMGLVQYSAKFIPNLATIGWPIMDLNRKHVKSVWDNEQQSEFEKLTLSLPRSLCDDLVFLVFPTNFFRQSYKIILLKMESSFLFFFLSNFH